MSSPTPLSIYSFDSYRGFLKAFLARKKSQNRSYSLRSFALKLKMTPGNLSEVMKGKKNLSMKKSSEVAKRLFETGAETKRFIELVHHEQAHGIKKHQIKESRKRQHPGQFQIFKHWYYVAVLDMLTLKKYQAGYETMALDLGLSENQISEAIDHLIAVGLVEETPEGFINKAGDAVYVADFDERYLKSFYHEMLSRAQRALVYQKTDTRYNATETILINREQLPQAQAIINKCLDDLLALFKSHPDRAEIYHIGVQMFSLKTQYSLSEKKNDGRGK